LYGGRNAGVLVLSEPLSHVMLRFQEVSGIDTALTLPLNSRFESVDTTVRWDKHLSALTRPGRMRGMLNRAAAVYELSALDQGVRFIDVDKRVYHLQSMPLEDRALLLISDISDDFARMSAARLETIRWSLVSLVVAELLLLLLLSFPLRRFARVEKALALLSAGRLDALQTMLDEKSAPGTSDLDAVLQNLIELMQLKSAVNVEEEAVSQASSQDGGLFDRVGMPLLQLDKTGIICRSNAAFQSLCGQSSTRLAGQCILTLFRNNPDGALRAGLHDVFAGFLSEYSFRATVEGDDGDVYTRDWQVVAFRSVLDGERYLLCSGSPPGSDMNDAQRSWLQLHDKETACLNATGLEEKLDSIWAKMPQLASIEVLVLHFPLDNQLGSDGQANTQSRARIRLLEEVEQSLPEPKSIVRAGTNFFVVLSDDNSQDLDNWSRTLDATLSQCCHTMDLDTTALRIDRLSLTRGQNVNKFF